MIRAQRKQKSCSHAEPLEELDQSGHADQRSAVGIDIHLQREPAHVGLSQQEGALFESSRESIHYHGTIHGGGSQYSQYSSIGTGDVATSLITEQTSWSAG